MGGIGSGRHWQFGADTTEGYRSINVRSEMGRVIMSANGKLRNILSISIPRPATWVVSGIGSSGLPFSA